jgi:hypothetical protein
VIREYQYRIYNDLCGGYDKSWLVMEVYSVLVKQLESDRNQPR